MLPALRWTTALALLLTACAHAGPPEPTAAPAPIVATAAPSPAEDPAPSTDPTVAQRIEFDGDEPEPPPLIRAAPKRPPLPRMQLFGTRPTDGP